MRIWAVRVALAACLTLLLAGPLWGHGLEGRMLELEAENAELSSRIDDLARRLASVEKKANCGDEYGQALAYTTTYGYETGVVIQWDGTPWIVDIASTFSNARELLDVVAAEAAQVRAVLGYDIFVAGDVMPLRRLTHAQFYDLDTLDPDAEQLVPRDQHIEFYCCYDVYDGSAGVAYPWRRVVLLKRDASDARHIILHELYHVLGFAHPGDDRGVEMSDVLMWGNVGHTASTPADLFKLACIYD